MGVVSVGCMSRGRATRIHLLKSASGGGGRACGAIGHFHDNVGRSVLESSEVTPALVTRNVLSNLGMVDDVQELDAAMADDVKNAERLADGAAGDSVKYKAAALQMCRRWELFLAIYVDGACSEPTLELVKEVFPLRQRFRLEAHVLEMIRTQSFVQRP